MLSIQGTYWFLYCCVVTLLNKFLYATSPSFPSDHYFYQQSHNFDSTECQHAAAQTTCPSRNFPRIVPIVKRPSQTILLSATVAHVRDSLFSAILSWKYIMPEIPLYQYVANFLKCWTFGVTWQRIVSFRCCDNERHYQPILTRSFTTENLSASCPSKPFLRIFTLSIFRVKHLHCISLEKSSSNFHLLASPQQIPFLKTSSL